MSCHQYEIRVREEEAFWEHVLENVAKHNKFFRTLIAVRDADLNAAEAKACEATSLVRSGCKKPAPVGSSPIGVSPKLPIGEKV